MFGSDAKYGNDLSALLDVLFGQTVQVLREPKVSLPLLFWTTHEIRQISDRKLLPAQDFSADPDLADDCFLLASRCVRYCPTLVLASPRFPQLIDCGRMGMLVQHR